MRDSAGRFATFVGANPPAGADRRVPGPSGTLRRLAAIALSAGLTAALPSAVIASAPGDVSPAEAALLPYWCKYRTNLHGQRTASEVAADKAFLARYGGGWSHMHHYCWALVYINRISRFSMRKRYVDSTYKSAEGNLLYVLRNTETQRDFTFRPDVLSELIRLYLLMGDADKAVPVARRYAADWPTLAEPHVLLARSLIAVGSRRAAEDALAKGEAVVADKAEFAELRTRAGLQ